MLRRNIQLLTLTLLSSAALAVPRAEASDIFIDEFTLNFLTTGTNTDAGGYLASRTATVFAGTGEIRVSGGDLIVTDDSTAGITADLLWPSTANVPADSNLVAGTNDRFELVISSVTGADWVATVFAFDGSDNDSVPVPINSGGGIYTFLFSDFSFTLTSVDQLTLRLQNTGYDANATIRASEFRAVPEPGSAALLTLGLFGLAAGSPRRRVAA